VDVVGAGNAAGAAEAADAVDAAGVVDIAGAVGRAGQLELALGMATEPMAVLRRILGSTAAALQRTVVRGCCTEAAMQRTVAAAYCTAHVVQRTDGHTRNFAVTGPGIAVEVVGAVVPDSTARLLSINCGFIRDAC
jgi:hypothetical protein